MPAEENQQEKTEQATPRRREETRKKGQVAKSIEINSAMIMLITFIFLYFFGGSLIDKFKYYGQVVFENIHLVEITTENLPGYIINVFSLVALFIGPILVVMLLVGLASNFAQVGFYITGEPLIPKWNKINPVAGLKRIFGSKKAVAELIKNILKIIIVVTVAYVSIRKEVADYIPMMDMEPWQIFGIIAWETFVIGIKIFLVLVALSAMDYAFQRWDFEQSIKMTKQEVRDELKQMEGDPLIKARVRSIQREMARQRMMAEVPEADVVVTNPTFLALAIKYDPKIMDAPTMIAKGARLIAEKIRDLAKVHGIPIVENKPLAQALYKAVEVGDEIPEEFFQAVAEILAYVYRLKGKKAIPV